MVSQPDRKPLTNNPTVVDFSLGQEFFQLTFRLLVSCFSHRPNSSHNWELILNFEEENKGNTTTALGTLLTLTRCFFFFVTSLAIRMIT
jgi:hypothetical protein